MYNSLKLLVRVLEYPLIIIIVHEIQQVRSSKIYKFLQSISSKIKLEIQ